MGEGAFLSVEVRVTPGPPEELFSNVLDATVLGDGTVVVGQFMRNVFELLYFAPLLIAGGPSG